MLKVVEGVRLLGATDPQHGNVQTLLERLLVEAVAGNYRHFLHEHLVKAQQYPEAPEQYCWPPLMSNERQVGGLFASALSSVCPVSRPEVAIRRPPRKKDAKAKKADRRGSIDFVALFGSRYIGLEVKQVNMSTTAAGSLGVVIRKWKDVAEQSQGVMAHLRDQPKTYRKAEGQTRLNCPPRQLATPQLILDGIHDIELYEYQMSVSVSRVAATHL